MIKIVFATIAALVFTGCHASEQLVSTVMYDGSAGPLCLPTQLTVEKGNLIIADYSNDRFVFKGLHSSGKWESSTLKIHQAHNIEVDKSGNYVFPDIGQNRVVVAKCLQQGCIVKSIVPPSGNFVRPHAIAISKSGSIFVLDGIGVTRVSSDYKTFKELVLPPNIHGYARSIKFIDDTLYIANSSSGNFIRVDDFDNSKYTVLSSPMHHINDGAGAFDTTGLVVNDLEYYRGYFYASNYFTSSYSKGADPNKMRLIRWKNWSDFESGKIDDVSYLIPKDHVPYFMSVFKGQMFLTSFDHARGTCGVFANVWSIHPRGTSTKDH